MKRKVRTVMLESSGAKYVGRNDVIGTVDRRGDFYPMQPPTQRQVWNEQKQEWEPEE